MKLTDPVHFSNVKKIAESPAHFLASLEHNEDNLGFRLGRLTHALVLGAQSGVKWAVYDGVRRGKEWEVFKAANEGVDIFTKSELEPCQAMANAVLANPLAASLIEGEFEVPVEWTSETGRRCATRGIDILNRPRRYSAELKTNQTSHPMRFTRDALRYGYHAQGAWMHDAAKSIGAELDTHYIIVVEKKAPYVVTVLRLTARALLEGRKLCRSWMEQLKACEEAGEFPGYCQSIVELDVPDEDDDIVLVGDENEEAA